MNIAILVWTGITAIGAINSARLYQTVCTVWKHPPSSTACIVLRDGGILTVLKAATHVATLAINSHPNV